MIFVPLAAAVPSIPANAVVPLGFAPSFYSLLVCRAMLTRKFLADCFAHFLILFLPYPSDHSLAELVTFGVVVNVLDDSVEPST
jgi:hypothetical protein